MELYGTTVVWHGDGKLTVYDKTQGVQNVQHYLCGVFGMKPDDVRVMGPYMGGGFGSGLRPQYNVALAVLAARALQRSVRLVLIAPADVLAQLSSSQRRTRCAWSEGGRNARCDHARSVRDDLAVRGLCPQGHHLGRRALQEP